MKVFILATCRRDDLLPYATLVFKTLRVGFPTADVRVISNALEPAHLKEVQDAAFAVGCDIYPGISTIHHLWIEGLVAVEKEPFWIVDTDMVFYEKVEDWRFDTALAGYRTPEFFDEFVGAITRPRLHTSLLYVDPTKLWKLVTTYEGAFPDTPFNPHVNLFYPLCLPLNGQGYFSDTCSMLYQAIGGTAFTDAQKDAYFHFHFGSISDLVLPRLQNGELMGLARENILRNPQHGKGLWREQDAYYAQRFVNRDGVDVIAKIKEQDSRDARAWNQELCRGDVEAMAFCDQWYGYVHGIDDLVDTMVDGRPMMSKGQMISLFFGAACLYNTSFYKKNAEMLFPLILDITNNYAISVEWEQAPQAHLRQMADLLRMGGNRMYSMVALLCGGEHHALEMAKRINERDWLGQHDATGRPI